MKKTAVVALSLALTIFVLGAFIGCSKKESSGVTVKIGVTGDAHPQWDYIKKTLAKEGINIELVKFSDYVQPNAALANGEVDLNAFQTFIFLNHEKEVKGYKIVAIGKTIIAPLGLFSKKIKSISEFKKGDTIALPSDVTTTGRGLYVLQKAGLIKLAPTGKALPNVNNITSNPLGLKFIFAEAAQTPRLLDDVTAAFINGGHAVDAGFNPQKDSILIEKQEEGEDNPYINTIVAREADKDNPIYKRIVDEYHTPAVRDIILKEFKEAYQPAW